MACRGIRRPLSLRDGYSQGPCRSSSLPNSILFPVVCLSVMSLGVIITTTDPLNTPAEIAKQIKDSNPVLAFTTSQVLPKIVVTAKLPIVLMDEERVDSLVKVRRLMEMMKKVPSGNRVMERVDQDDTATLLYSSGTTGMSKGVISSHRNLIAMVQTVVTRFGSDDGSQGEQRFICTVPMFHIYGLAAFATGLLVYGSMISPNSVINDFVFSVFGWRKETRAIMSFYSSSIVTC